MIRSRDRGMGTCIAFALRTPKPLLWERWDWSSGLRRPPGLSQKVSCPFIPTRAAGLRQDDLWRPIPWEFCPRFFNDALQYSLNLTQ